MKQAKISAWGFFMVLVRNRTNKYFPLTLKYIIITREYICYFYITKGKEC